MTHPADRLPDPPALLRLAYQNWASSGCWTISEEGTGVTAAVRPGIQWINAVHLDGVVVIEGPVARVRGSHMLDALIGVGTDHRRLESVVRGRWVTCAAQTWLRQGRDRSAVGWFGKGLGADPDDTATIVDALVDVDRSAVQVRLQTSAGVVTVRQESDGSTRFVACTASRGDTLRWSFDDVPLELPAVGRAGVVPLEAVNLALGRRPRTRPSRRPATVDVSPPVRPGAPWQLRSTDLATTLGATAGAQAEEFALAALQERAPHLAHLVTGDSSGSVFAVTVPDEDTARAVAAVLRTL